MAKETPPEDLMQYEAMAQDALRGVVKAALKRAASPAGLPGDHHFYITFRTQAPGVEIPGPLRAKYPDEMTIVLQHQYRDLAPGESFFSVTLKFGGQPNRLSVPYTAVSRFYDPSVNFVLQFLPPEAEVTSLPEAPEPQERPDPPPSSGGDDAPKVVSLDQFRKK
jgi:hypothetical protein